MATMGMAASLAIGAAMGTAIPMVTVIGIVTSRVTGTAQPQ